MKVKVKWKCVIFLTLTSVISNLGMFIQRHCSHQHPKPTDVSCFLFTSYLQIDFKNFLAIAEFD